MNVIRAKFICDVYHGVHLVYVYYSLFHEECSHSIFLLDRHISDVFRNRIESSPLLQSLSSFVYYKLMLCDELGP